MAFLRSKSHCHLLSLCKSFYLNAAHEGRTNGRTRSVALSRNPRRLFRSGSRAACDDVEKTDQAAPLTDCAVTNEIRLYRDCRNRFTETSFSDTKQPYGPPLAILLPWKDFDGALLRKFIELYGEKGFDVLTVTLTTEQFLYPCVAGNAMNVVTELLEYLNETHKHRPYVFHGFSIGVYVFGEILSQFADNYDAYRTITNNVKGCLWDSPVDFLTVKPYVGKFFHPGSWSRRFFLNRAVRHHFKKHYYDSVVYWLRARESFCNPIIKVPNVFFVSYTDVLSNPCSLQSAQKVMECNGIPVFQKTWWDSVHARHFEKYCYEYMYGMVLFLHLANFFPDECGKYKSSSSTASLTSIRLSKTARDHFC